MQDNKSRLAEMAKMSFRRANNVLLGMDENALTVIENGALNVGGLKLAPTGLTMPDDITLDDWKKLGGFLATLHGSLKWIIGDWINGADETWGDKYTIAEQVTGLKNGTLRNLASIAGKVELSLRNDKLTYNHHVAVASLDPDLQKQWLAWAEQEKLSYRDLRQQIKRQLATDAQRQQSERLTERRQRVRTVTKAAALAWGSKKPLTLDEFEVIEAQVSEMIEALRKRVK